MALKNRVLKLERSNNSGDFIMVLVNYGETNEQAYQRSFPDGIKHKALIYVSPVDEYI
jgi:hypothetical protein